MRLILISLFFLVVGFFGTCRAGDQNSLVIGIGKSFAKSDVTDFNSTGHTVNYAFDRKMGDGRFAVGLNLTFINQRESFRDVAPPVDIFITAAPLYLQGRLGHTFDRLPAAAYVGAGVGVHQTVLQAFEIGSFNEERDEQWGAAANFVLSAAWLATDTMSLDAFYQLHWLDQSPFDNNIAHTLAAAVGFRFGQ